MEKTRVPRGKKYWYINDGLLILECIETDSPIDKARFEAGNYFHSSHKLSDMSFKLEKVLKGADVIEMPSKEEIELEANEIQVAAIKDKQLHKYELPYDMCAKVGAEIMADFFKSKIVK